MVRAYIWPFTKGMKRIGCINLITVITLIVTISACKHSPLTTEDIADAVNNMDTTSTGGGGGNGGNYGIPCDPDSVYFQNTILPLFVSNCAKSGCHDVATAQEGIILNSYANIMASGEIQPGDASEGDIMEVIMENDPDKVMPPPPNQTLSPQQINMMAQWINQGAQNNYCDACDTSNVTYAGKIRPLLDGKCVGCHNNTLASSDVNLSNYSGVQTVALNGRLYGAVSHTAGYFAMPQGGAQLPACEIAAIRIWIQSGAINN